MSAGRVLAGAGAVIAVGYGVAAATRRWWRAWGADPLEEVAPLPGDELVTDPVAVDTRGIDIAAPVADVWPWLAQMGFGRAGWYSYDAIDMLGRSADRLLPEFQLLEPGDVVPTHPGGGFVVRAVDAGRSLVLYRDAAVAEQQAAAHPDDAPRMPANLRASGAMIGSAGTDFAVSWAFVLQPTATGTRLVERLRVRFTRELGVAPLAGPLVGFGVFLMVRRQLIGIRERAERQVRERAERETGPTEEAYVVAPEPLVAAPA